MGSVRLWKILWNDKTPTITHEGSAGGDKSGRCGLEKGIVVPVTCNRNTQEQQNHKDCLCVHYILHVLPVVTCPL